MASVLHNPVPFERRTLVVWAALAASMTGVSGLLMLLEPSPRAPVGGPVLSVIDAGPLGIDALFATHPAPDPHRWQAIVIHHSGSSHGNERTLGEQHQALGYGGLGYHFVIGNGYGAGDGEIQVGYRWMRQMDGHHVFTPEGPAFNRHAIAICLIGNGDAAAPTDAQIDQLLRLVHALQRRLSIGPERVLLHSNLAQTSSPGLLFPVARLRQQLLAIAEPPAPATSFVQPAP